MEADRTIPIKPTLEAAPKLLTLSSQVWDLSGAPEAFAVYKRAGRPFHLTVNVRTGRTHASPEGGPLAGTALHVYAYRVDNYVASYLADAAHDWLSQHQGEMQALCQEVRQIWADQRKLLRTLYKAAREEYYEEKRQYDAWLSENSPTHAEELQGRVERERQEHTRRRLRDGKLEAAAHNPAQVEKMPDGRWKIGPINRRKVFYLAPREIFQLAQSKSMWTPEAYQLADGEFLIVGHRSKLYICSLNDLTACERVSDRMLWVAGLDQGEHDSSGFLRVSDRSFRATDSTMMRIREESNFVRPRTDGCFKVQYKGRTVVVWPDNPSLPLATEEQWLAWYGGLREATMDGSVIIAGAGAEAGRFELQGPMPPEPPVGTPGCWRIASGTEMLVAKLEGNPESFKMINDSQLRSRWISGLPKAHVTISSNNVPYIKTNESHYRAGRGDLDNIIKLSEHVPTGTPNSYQMIWGQRKNIVFCLGIQGQRVAPADTFEQLVAGLPEAGVKNEILTIDLPGRPRFRLKRGKLPVKDSPIDVTGACRLVVNGETLILAPVLDPDYFEEIAETSGRKKPSPRRSWIDKLPVGIMDSSCNITLGATVYKPPRRIASAIRNHSHMIPTGTPGCFMLETPGDGTIGPVLSDFPDDPLIPLENWTRWKQGLWTARRISDDIYIIPGNLPEFVRIDFTHYDEPLIGTQGCFLAPSPQFGVLPVDPADARYCRRLWVDDYDEYDLVTGRNADWLVRESGTTENSWEALFCARLSDQPTPGRLALLMEEAQGRRMWSGLFITAIGTPDKAAWAGALGKREDAVLISVDSMDEENPMEGTIEVGGKSRVAVSLDTRDPALCFFPPDPGWFLARFDGGWRPVLPLERPPDGAI